MRVLICGRLSVEHDAVVVPESALPGRLGRRLWAYLVLHRRRPVGRSELMTALWDDESPDAVDTSLNALISRVRGALARLGDDVASRAVSSSRTAFASRDTACSCARSRRAATARRRRRSWTNAGRHSPR